MNERAVADQLLENFLVDLAFRHTGVEQHDADVEQVLLGDAVGRRRERHGVSDDDFRARAPGQPPGCEQQQSDTAHGFPLHSVACDELLVFVVFVPECPAEEWILLLGGGFAKLPRYAVLIVATGDGGNRRRIGP